VVRRAGQYRLLAVICLVALFGTWFAAFHVGLFEHADQSVFSGFADLNQHPRVSALATYIARLCDPQPFVFLALIPVAVAVLRGRPRLAIAIAAILLGANVTTELLKPLLAHPRAAWLLGGRAPVAAASWPSGHATAAMSLTLASVLAAPGRLRPVVATLGAGFTAAVSYSFLTLGWHYPSDVFGGFLVAASWTLAVVAALLSAEQRHAPSTSDPPSVAQGARMSLRGALAPPGAALLGAVGLAVAVAVARPQQVVVYARAHEAFVVGATAIGALALLLATGLMLVLRRSALSRSGRHASRSAVVPELPPPSPSRYLDARQARQSPSHGRAPSPVQPMSEGTTPSPTTGSPD
jgi:membrane-associated phospholipid phosphatase